MLVVIEVPLGPEARDLPDPAASPFAVAAQMERDRILRAIVRALPARERKLLKLRYDAGVTLYGIGRRWGISEAAVSQLHARILRTLAARLADNKILVLGHLL